MKGYWLTVNRTFLSIESMKAATPYQEVTIDSTPDDISWEIARDPLANRRGARVNNTAYFPMVVQFVRPCKQMWNANCVSFSETQNVRVPLIPVLDNPEECGKIGNPALSEQCRQLNTYQAAFRHVETIAQVRADKELCSKVGPEFVAKECLESLQLYIANPGAYENRLPLQMEIDPIEKVVILAPIGGMSVIRSGVGSLDPFRETANYGVCYSIDQWRTDSACVNVWSVVREEDRRWVFNFDGENGYTKGAERTEVMEGNTVTTLDLPNTYTAVWSSGARVVRVIFYKPSFLSDLGADRARAAAASPEVRRELLRQYLLKYPVPIEASLREPGRCSGWDSTPTGARASDRPVSRGVQECSRIKWPQAQSRL
jgi:hypothetical protein